MKSRVVLSKSNLRERRRRRRILLAVIAAVAVVVVVAALISLTWLPFARVRAVTVSGNKTVETADVQAFAQSKLAGTYGYLFPKNNILLYPRVSLQKELLQQFPAFATVAVKAKDFHTVAVSVIEREPSALWCGDQVASSTDCFLIDQTGVIYAPAVVYSGDAYQKYFGKAAGVVLPKQFLTPTQFHSLAVLVDSLQKKEDLPISSVSVDEVNDVRVAFSNGFTLIFALSDDGADVLDRFALALAADPFTVHPLADFEYLDLRFGDKLYYKLKTP